MNQEHPYSPDKFDKDYYGGRARGGFGEEIHWENPVQQDELCKKFLIINERVYYSNILFIGCALGNEVRYFRERNADAYGVEVSEYAVENCHPTVKDYVKLYNGWELKEFDSNSFDLIAAFDVLTLVPDDMLNKLVKEMCRVGKNIIFRNIVGENNEWIGNDGVTFRYLTLQQWIELFEAEGFKLRSVDRGKHNECLFYFSERF